MFEMVPVKYREKLKQIPFKNIIPKLLNVAPNDYVSLYAATGITPTLAEYEGDLRLVISDDDNPKGVIQIDFKSKDKFNEYHIIEADFRLINHTWYFNWWIMNNDHQYEITSGSI